MRSMTDEGAGEAAPNADCGSGSALSRPSLRQGHPLPLRGRGEAPRRHETCRTPLLPRSGRRGSLRSKDRMRAEPLHVHPSQSPRPHPTLAARGPPSPASRARGGASWILGRRASRAPDPGQQKLHAAECEIVGKSQNAVALPAQPRIARLVVRALTRIVVRRTVEFDHERVFDAEKIDEVSPDRNLSPELETCKPRAAKSAPEIFLSDGHIAPEFASEGQPRMCRTARHSPIRAVPVGAVESCDACFLLPQSGRRWSLRSKDRMRAAPIHARPSQSRRPLPTLAARGPPSPAPRARGGASP